MYQSELAECFGRIGSSPSTPGQYFLERGYFRREDAPQLLSFAKGRTAKPRCWSLAALVGGTLGPATEGPGMRRPSPFSATRRRPSFVDIHADD